MKYNFNGITYFFNGTLRKIAMPPLFFVYNVDPSAVNCCRAPWRVPLVRVIVRTLIISHSPIYERKDARNLLSWTPRDSLA